MIFERKYVQKSIDNIRTDKLRTFDQQKTLTTSGFDDKIYVQKLIDNITDR